MVRCAMLCVLAGWLWMPVASIAQAEVGEKQASYTSKVSITIHPVYGDRTLAPGISYVNSFGDTFFVDAFRFYICNTAFADAPATNSHLYDMDDSSTYTYTVATPPGAYNVMRFTLGVDSIANTNGANEGDLDPMKGMYWAWNSGYIMLKLEGHSKACHTLHNAFEFHIGGYMPPYNTARSLALTLPQQAEVTRYRTPAITLRTDLASWLNNIDLAKTNSILIPGKDAMAMADLYAKMFSASLSAPATTLQK